MTFINEEWCKENPLAAAKMIQLCSESNDAMRDEASRYMKLFRQMARFYVRTVEGDDVMTEAYDLMSKHGLVDYDGFWIEE